LERAMWTQWDRGRGICRDAKGRNDGERLASLLTGCFASSVEEQRKESGMDFWGIWRRWSRKTENQSHSRLMFCLSSSLMFFLAPFVFRLFFLLLPFPLPPLSSRPPLILLLCPFLLFICLFPLAFLTSHVLSLFHLPCSIYEPNRSNGAKESGQSAQSWRI